MHSPDRQDLPGTELLRLARGSVEYGLIHQRPLPIQYDDLHPALTEPFGQLLAYLGSFACN